jgi:hypothetical protein
VGGKGQRVEEGGKGWVSDPVLNPKRKPNLTSKSHFFPYRARISAESQHGLIAQVLKDRLFNTDLTAQPPMDPPAALMQQPDA